MRRFESVVVLSMLCFVSCLNSNLSAIEFYPLANVSVFGGQFNYNGAPVAAGGNLSASFIPAIKLSDSLSLLPSYYGEYRGTKDVTELVGGDHLYQQGQNHTVALKLIYKLDEELKFKLKTSYRLEYLREAVNESWNTGLFNYQKSAFGFETEKKNLAFINNMLIGVGYYGFMFPNYVALTTNPNAAEIVGSEKAAQIPSKPLDFGTIEAYTNLDFMLTETMMTKLSYNFAYQNYVEQKIVIDAAQNYGDKRRDISNMINLLVNYGIPLNENKLLFGLNLREYLYGSNQNYCKAIPNVYISDYYSFNEIKVSPSISFGWTTLNNLVISLSYEFGLRQYFGRLAQDKDANYLTDKTNILTNYVGLSVTYPILPVQKISLGTSINYLSSASNMKYEGTFKYDYSTFNCLLGVNWEY